MSRNVIVGIGAVVVVALIGLFAYMNMGYKPSTSPTSSGSESGESMMQGSLKSLIGVGKNQTCDITYTDGKGSGKIYVNDKKFRGDFDTMVDGKAYMSHMISDGTYAYTWTDDTKQGTKFSVEAMEKVSASPTSAQTQQGADLDANVDMKCSGWGVDNSKFIPPSDVTFTDMSAIMEKMTTPASSGAPQMNSSYCDSITDASAKAACISAISDN